MSRINKVYISNVADLFLSSLATICKAAVITIIENHIFGPLKNESTIVIEVCFVNRQYDLVIQKEVNFEIKMEDSASLTSARPTAGISNVKIEDADIFYEGLNETPLPAEGICILSESSQDDTVLADEDMSVLCNGKYFYSFVILSSLQMLSLFINSLNLF